MLAFTPLLIICSLVLVVLWGFLHWKHRRLITAANKMEGIFPICFPFLGHIPYTMFGLERATKWALDQGVGVLRRGKNLVCFWIGPFPLPIIAGAENIQKLLNSSCTSEKADEMRYFDSFVGHGLLNAPGSIWKIKRRHINPLFHPHNLEHMMPTFNRNSAELVANLSKHVGQGPFNVMDHIMDTALKTICHLIFGPDIEFDMNTQGFKGLRKIVERIPEILINRIIRVWLRIDVIFQFLYKKELDEINKLWRDFTETPFKIAKRRHEDNLKDLLQVQIENETTNITTTGKSEGILNLLDVHSVMEKKFPQFDETDLKFEMITLYATGTDTIGGAVSYCLLLLAHYQDVQERLYKEIADVVDPDGDITLENIQNLSYLDQVYKETLRWSVIVPLVARKTSEDLKLADVTIPAGYTVVVAIGANSLDPKIYPNPLSFDPERFSSENMAERERYTFLPFSGGPRSCIGQTYTNLFMKIMLVHILRRYKLTTKMDVHNLKKKMTITLVSVEGYEVTLENR